MDFAASPSSCIGLMAFRLKHHAIFDFFLGFLRNNINLNPNLICKSMATIYCDTDFNLYDLKSVKISSKISYLVKIACFVVEARSNSIYVQKLCVSPFTLPHSG